MIIIFEYYIVRCFSKHFTHTSTYYFIVFPQLLYNYFSRKDTEYQWLNKLAQDFSVLGTLGT